MRRLVVAVVLGCALGACMLDPSGHSAPDEGAVVTVTHQGRLSRYTYELNNDDGFARDRADWVPDCAVRYLDAHVELYAKKLGMLGELPVFTYYYTNRRLGSPATDGPPEPWTAYEGNIFSDQDLVDLYLKRVGSPPWWMGRAMSWMLIEDFPASLDWIRYVYGAPTLTDAPFELLTEEDWNWDETTLEKHAAYSFVEWMIEKKGLDAVLVYYSMAQASDDRELVDREFADVFGETFTQSLARWRAEVGPIVWYRKKLNLMHCDAPLVLSSEVPGRREGKVGREDHADVHRLGERFTIADQLTCGLHPGSVVSKNPGRSRFYAVELAGGGELVASVEAQRLTRIGVESCFSPPPDDETRWADSETQADGSHHAEVRVRLEPGRYVIRVAQDDPRDQGDDVTAYELSLQALPRAEPEQP